MPEFIVAAVTLLAGLAVLGFAVMEHLERRNGK
jgi:hypothetical protein